MARLAEVQLQALSNQRKQFMGKGTVRTMAPGTTFELSDHDEFLSLGADGQFVVLSATHRVHNNLSADAQTGSDALLARANCQTPTR